MVFLGDIDDIIYELSPEYISGATTVLLQVMDGELPSDSYQLTVVGSSMRNLAGIALDGDGNGTGGDNYFRQFSIDKDPPEVAALIVVNDTGASANDAVTSDTTPRLTVQFTEPVSGTAADVEIRDPQNNLIVPDSLIWDTQSLTIDFTTPLVLQGTYQITLIAAGIEDAAGHLLHGGVNQILTLVLDNTSPQVDHVTINSGQVQRSNVNQVTLRFSQALPVQSLIDSGAIDDVVKLYDKSQPTVAVNWLDEAHFQWNSYNNTLTIDLTVDALSGSDLTALADGRYELRLNTAAFADPAGNTLADTDGVDDGWLTVDRSTGATSQNFFRLFCDANGDAKVDGGDLAIWQINYDPIRRTYYHNPGQGDWNMDNLIDGGDLALWQQSYNPEGLPEAIPTPAPTIVLGDLPPQSVIEEQAAIEPVIQEIDAITEFAMVESETVLGASINPIGTDEIGLMVEPDLVEIVEAEVEAVQIDSAIDIDNLIVKKDNPVSGIDQGLADSEEVVSVQVENGLEWSEVIADQSDDILIADLLTSRPTLRAKSRIAIATDESSSFATVTRFGLQRPEPLQRMMQTQNNLSILSGNTGDIYDLLRDYRSQSTHRIS